MPWHARDRRHLAIDTCSCKLQHHSPACGGQITQAKTRGQRRRVTVVGGGSSESNITIDPALDASSASDFATDTDYPSDNDNLSDTATDYCSDASTDRLSNACGSAGPIAFNSLDLSDTELRLLQQLSLTS
ncbi:hypothetical protein B0H14DRAFT_3471065 [Mycena olivaceomarginata]|nr:hypothetical protein B0H14DRAFT_3471065 [Mycena olivaceomarginata]